MRTVEACPAATQQVEGRVALGGCGGREEGERDPLLWRENVQVQGCEVESPSLRRQCGEWEWEEQKRVFFQRKEKFTTFGSCVFRA